MLAAEGLAGLAMGDHAAARRHGRQLGRRGGGADGNVGARVGLHAALAGRYRHGHRVGAAVQGVDELVGARHGHAAHGVAVDGRSGGGGADLGEDAARRRRGQRGAGRQGVGRRVGAGQGLVGAGHRLGVANHTPCRCRSARRWSPSRRSGRCPPPSSRSRCRWRRCWPPRGWPGSRWETTLPPAVTAVSLAVVVGAQIDASGPALGFTQPWQGATVTATVSVQPFRV